jgi:hypothetical protein
MENNITNLCALLLVINSTVKFDDVENVLKTIIIDSNNIESDIKKILTKYNSLQVDFDKYKNALTRLENKTELYQELTASSNSYRNVPPIKKTKKQQYDDKGNEISNYSIAVSDYINNYYSKDLEAKKKSIGIIKKIKELINL